MQNGTRDTASPLAKHRLFQTKDLDEARAIVAGKFCDHRLDLASKTGRFDACHHRAEGRAASLNYIRYGADVRIEPGELQSFYLIQIPLAGSAEIDNGSGETGSGVGCGSVLNPHRHTRMRWHEGCSQILLQIDADHLNRVAERMTGRALKDPVTFQTAVDEANRRTAGWVARLRTCIALADRGAIFGSESASTQVLVEEELIEGFLRAQPSDIAGFLEGGERAAQNIHVRRAVQYMREHLSEVITVGDVATAAGVTPRSLQLGFRAEFDMTPLQFLREERLRQARHFLLNGSSGERIGDICERVGFSHFGRFSVAYRKRYGECPGQTKG